MDKVIKELADYRLSKAKEDLETSEINFEAKKYSQSLNRSYYSIFHCARALLAYEKFDSKKHTGIISFFNKNFIKEKKIEEEYFLIIKDAEMFRMQSDYQDFFIVSREDAQGQLENAKKFMGKISEYISETYA